jgi:hypothetical protein
MLFAKILLTRILNEISGSELLRDEQFVVRPHRSTVLLLARLVERVSRDFGQKRLTGTVFLDVAKTFSILWVDGLLYKLTGLNFPSYFVKIIFSCLYDWMFEASFQSATCTRGMRAGMYQGGIVFPVLFSLYVKDIHTPSHHVRLALYADDTAVLAPSRQPALLVSTFK